MAIKKVGHLIVALAAVAAAMPPESPAPAAFRNTDLQQEETKGLPQYGSRNAYSNQENSNYPVTNDASYSERPQDFPLQDQGLRFDGRQDAPYGPDQSNSAQREFRLNANIDQRNYRGQSFENQQTQLQGQNYGPNPYEDPSQRNNDRLGQNVNQDLSETQQYNQRQGSRDQFVGQRTGVSQQQNVDTESFSSASFQNQQRTQNQYSEVSSSSARIPGAVPNNVENSENQEFQRSNTRYRGSQRYDDSLNAQEDPSVGNYQYSYDIRSEDTGDMKYHKESRDGNKVIGEYRVKEADGSMRIVKYTADAENGFQATVEYVMEDEEPVEFGAKMVPKSTASKNQRNFGNKRVFEPARSSPGLSNRNRERPVNLPRPEKTEDMSLFLDSQTTPGQARPRPALSGDNRDFQQLSNTRYDESFQESLEYQHDSRDFPRNFQTSEFVNQETSERQFSQNNIRGQPQTLDESSLQGQSRRPFPFQSKGSQQFQERDQAQVQKDNRFQNQNRNQERYNFDNREREQYLSQNRKQFQNENSNQFQGEAIVQIRNQDRSQFDNQEQNQFQIDNREQFSSQNRNRFQNQDRNLYESNERDQRRESQFKPQNVKPNQRQNLDTFQNQRQNSFQGAIQNQGRHAFNEQVNSFQSQESQTSNNGRNTFQSQYQNENNNQFQQQRDQYDLQENPQYSNNFETQRNEQHNSQRRIQSQGQIRQQLRSQEGNQFQNPTANRPVQHYAERLQTQNNEFQDFEENNHSRQRVGNFPSQGSNQFQNQNRLLAHTNREQFRASSLSGPQNQIKDEIPSQFAGQNRLQYREQQSNVDEFLSSQQSQSEEQRYGVDSENGNFQGVYHEMNDKRYENQRYGQNNVQDESSTLDQGEQFSRNQQNQGRLSPIVPASPVNEFQNQHHSASLVGQQPTNFNNDLPRTASSQQLLNKNFLQTAPQGASQEPRFGLQQGQEPFRSSEPGTVPPQGPVRLQRFETIAEPHPQA
ncbi:uncharacterized protein DDB_G0287625-like isoform X2 [Palaemon carinicauda]|uniref:uncharacterized protein DDB_G0287625-like isoform X2 n=1 Tax=Palaemon carinicauda TaxID=392227 RepID=UPI0035B5D26F